MSTPNFASYTTVELTLFKSFAEQFDLSEFWSTIEYEDALPQSCKITLNSKFGEFMTVDPIIEKFDKIHLKITDVRDNVIDDVFHVRKIKRGRKIGKNKQIELFCPHQSENLWKRTISLVARRTSGADALNQLVPILGAAGTDPINNRGTEDPIVEMPAQNTIRKVGNFLDPNTSNNYIFETVKLETAFKEISDIEQQPVEGGGSFEAIFIRFKSKFDSDNPVEAELNTVQIQAFPQGFQDDGTASNTFTNIPNVTLIHQPLKSTATPPTNILAFESDEDPELATNLMVVGDRNSGSYPVEWMKFQGAKDVFNNAKSWDSTADYVIGNLVNSDGTVFEATNNNTNSKPPNTNWLQRNFAKPPLWSPSAVIYSVDQLVIFLELAWKCIQANTSDGTNGPPNEEFWVTVYYVPAVEYSPLTDQEVQAWVNALAGAKFAVGAGNEGKVCMIDPNVIVNDQLHPRTFVRFVGQQPSQIPAEDLISENPPDGYRVLVINPANGTSVGLGIWASPNIDRNGVLFAGNIVEFVDPLKNGTGEWVVFKSKVLGQDQEVFDWHEAVSWVNRPCTGAGSYVDDDGVCQVGSRGTIWEKGSYAIQNIPFVGTFGVWIANRLFECAHSVKWDDSNDHIELGTVKIINDDDGIGGNSGIFIKSEPTIIPGTDANPYYIGFNFWSLWPVTDQDDTEFPGAYFAPGQLINQPTFDFNNMFRDHNGLPTMFGPSTEDYLPIQKFAMWMQFLITRIGGIDILNLTDGDFEIGIWLADRRDNIRIISMTQPRIEEIFPQEGNLPGEPYKGVPGASTVFSAAEPDTTDAFDPREFLVGGIYTRDSFDKQGRYLGVKSRFNTTSQLQLNIDGFRMIKPLVATNIETIFPSDKPSRNIGTQLIKKPGIVSYAQLKNLSFGLDKIFNFNRRAFKETTGGRCDIQFGDSVFYTDSEEIPDIFDEGGGNEKENTIRGVNTKNTISLSKGKNGPGGFTAIFDLVTRIWPT